MNLAYTFHHLALGFLMFNVLQLSANTEHNLVELISLMPSIVLDIRYATENNFTKQKIYTSSKCYLLHDVALAVAQAQKELQPLGIGLKIWDGYRPLSAQWALWRVVPDERYVSDPRKGGRHTRGTAIDLTLIDLATGKELAMPTEFDDFTEKAWRSCAELSAEAIKNRQLLEEVMQRHGFKGFEYEWWHFDYTGWQEKPSLDIDFETIEA